MVLASAAAGGPLGIPLPPMLPQQVQVHLQLLMLVLMLQVAVVPVEWPAAAGVPLAAQQLPPQWGLMPQSTLAQQAALALQAIPSMQVCLAAVAPTPLALATVQLQLPPY